MRFNALGHRICTKIYPYTSLHEWHNVLKSARHHKPYSIKTLQHRDFFDLKPLANKLLTNCHKLCDGSTLNWLSIRALCVEKAHPDKVFFKTDFSETEFTVLLQNHQKKSRVQYKLTRAYKCELSISAAKHKDLMSMISDKVIPENYRQFYDSLPVCPQTKDYVPDKRGDDGDFEADD